MLKRSPSIAWLPLLPTFIIVFFVFTGCTTTHVATTPPQDYQDYYEPPPPPLGMFGELSVYGEWLSLEPFGQVWRPDVVSGWRPYAYGHWIWSNWGWTWVSYEPFGWAVYHYGYWHYDPIWGWLWTPADKWFSARATWLVYDDYVCWAPMPPPGYDIGAPWTVDVPFIWSVVPAKFFTKEHIYRFTVRTPKLRYRPGAETKIKRKAPELRLIEKYENRNIRPAKVKVKKVSSGTETYKRMQLPPSQKKKVDRSEPRIEQKVLRPEAKKKTSTGKTKKKKE